MDRLEEIKNKPYFNTETRNDRVNSDDIVWLINRVGELQNDIQKVLEENKELKTWYHSYNKEAKLSNQLKLENKQLQEALDKVIAKNNEVAEVKNKYEKVLIDIAYCNDGIIHISDAVNKAREVLS